jgi:hypothetical protein
MYIGGVSVMKKYSQITFCFTILLLFLTACQLDSNLTEESTAQELPNSENNVTVATEKAQYSKSVEKIIVEIQNDSNTDFSTGTNVFLDKKVEETWYNVPMEADSFTEAAMIHNSGGTSSMFFNVKNLKYALTVGEYRATINGLAAPFKIVE